jgi:hypothetical protein
MIISIYKTSLKVKHPNGNDYDLFMELDSSSEPQVDGDGLIRRDHQSVYKITIPDYDKKAHFNMVFKTVDLYSMSVSEFVAQTVFNAYRCIFNMHSTDVNLH